MKRISIDPITRLEGHGRVDLFLNEDGGLENAYMVIPELRDTKCGICKEECKFDAVILR